MMGNVNFKKVYIAGALTEIDDEDNRKNFYENLGKVCSEANYIPYIPHLSKKALSSNMIKKLTPKRIFDWDIEKVLESDLVVAYVGYPSMGVGIELGYAACLNIPIITICEKGESISPMILGHKCLVQHIEYSNEIEAFHNLSLLLKEVDTINAT